MPSSEATIQSALAIASKDLRWCYRERGIITGRRLVYWSWDSFFASLGADCLGDFEVVRLNLQTYLDLQHPNGSLPKRIANPLYFWKFLGFPISEKPEKQRPTYWNTYYTGPSLAQNPTLIIALHDYIQATGDWKLLDAYKTHIEKVMGFLARQEGKQGLLHEGIGGGWAESVLKRGAISFTNVCYARSAWCLSELYTKSGDKERAAYYERKYKLLKDEINTFLWSDEDGGYYSDWHGFRRHHHFATDGNLLAILWDIASPRQASCIQAKIDELSLEDDVPIRLAYSDYSFWRVYIFNRLGGMKDYHVGFCWTWLGCIDAMARYKIGKKEEARAILRRIAKVIVQDGTVHEAYNNGKPVHNFYYKGEEPWGWGAGLFVKACYTLGYNLQENHAA